MTTTYNLLVNWLLRIGAIDHAGIAEVNEYDDPESYLCGVGFEYLKPWEQEVLRMVYVFGPIPMSQVDLSLIDKGYLIHDRGLVIPTASTCSFMELA
jgi:hypothetical protein